MIMRDSSRCATRGYALLGYALGATLSFLLTLFSLTTIAAPEDNSLNARYSRLLWTHFLQDSESARKVRVTLEEAQSLLKELGAPVFEEDVILISPFPETRYERDRLYLPFIFFLGDEAAERVAWEWLSARNHPERHHPTLARLSPLSPDAIEKRLTDYARQPIPRQWELFFLEEGDDITFQFRRIPELGGVVIPCRLDKYLQTKIDGTEKYPREEIRLAALLSEPLRFRLRSLLRNTAHLEENRSAKLLLGEGIIGFLIWLRTDRPLKYIARRSLRWPARFVTFFGSFIVVDGLLGKISDRLGIENGIRKTHTVPRRHLEEIVFFLERSYEEGRVGNLSMEQFQYRFYELLNREAENSELRHLLGSVVEGTHRLAIPPGDPRPAEQYNYCHTLLVEIEEELSKVRLWRKQIEEATEVIIEGGGRYFPERASATLPAREGNVSPPLIEDEIRMIYEIYLPFFIREDSEWLTSRFLLNRLKGTAGRRIWILPQEYQEILIQLEEAGRRLFSLKNTYAGMIERWKRLNEK